MGFFVCGMMCRLGEAKEYEMKKLYPLLSLLFLIYWGCEDKKDDADDTNPLVGVYDMTSVVLTIQSNPTQTYTFTANGTTNSIVLILAEDGSYSTTGQLDGDSNTFGGTWSSTGNKLTLFETSPETLTEIYDYTLSGSSLIMTITIPETADTYELSGTFNYTKQ